MHTHVSALCTLCINLLISQPHTHITVEGLPCGRCFALWLIRQELGKRHVWWAVSVEAGFELHPELRVFELVGGGEIEIIIGLDKLKDQMWGKWIKKLKPIRLRF